MKALFLPLLVVVLVIVCALLFWQNRSLNYVLNEFNEEKIADILRESEENEVKLDGCLTNAELEREEYIELNGTLVEVNGEQVVRTGKDVYDTADSRLDAERDNCYRRYKD